jgi:predicted GIY-YIG superfamily endonuclease
MVVYCVYILKAGGRIAYAGSSGRIEDRLQRHFRGWSSAAGRGLRPDAAYVLACARSRSLALAWEAWLHRAYRPPYAARAPRAPAKRPPHPPSGWYVPRGAVYRPLRPPPPPLPSASRPRAGARPPRPALRAWDGVRDGGPGPPAAAFRLQGVHEKGLTGG